ncbi:hypothetical protein O181_062167 [Austropuccinia psidii MF-1]|uniref:Secreted protein n=1 Tax=Austropuccinia psidii MF-1 TaxID=1389203 RepID=A0A9Q3ERR8_9BASI|nr:hypothetical protein [Austropuccinia psidii MF-1]
MGGDTLRLVVMVLIIFDCDYAYGSGPKPVRVKEKPATSYQSQGIWEAAECGLVAKPPYMNQCIVEESEDYQNGGRRNPEQRYPSSSSLFPTADQFKTTQGL